MFEQQPKRNNEWFFDQVTNKHAFLLQGLMTHLEEREPALYRAILEIQQLEPKYSLDTEISVHSDLGLRLSATLGGILNELTLLADFPELADYLEDIMDIWNEVKQDINLTYTSYLIGLEEDQTPALSSESDVKKRLRPASGTPSASDTSAPSTAISLHRASLPNESEILASLIRESTNQDLEFASLFVQAFVSQTSLDIDDPTNNWERTNKSLIFLTLYLLLNIDINANADNLANFLGISQNLTASFIAWYYDAGLVHTQNSIAAEAIAQQGLKLGTIESPYEGT